MAEADGSPPRPLPKPAGLLLVVAAAAFESLAVATILPLVVRDCATWVAWRSMAGRLVCLPWRTSSALP
jgi:hypothetical protein